MYGPRLSSSDEYHPSANHAYFAFGETEITSRLIEGEFPDYQRIIPADTKTRVKVSTTDFLRATRAAAVFARDNSNIVRLECSPAKENADLALGSILVKSTSAEIDDNEGNLDAVDGDDTQIAFNGRYLRDAAMIAKKTPLRGNPPMRANRRQPRDVYRQAARRHSRCSNSALRPVGLSRTGSNYSKRPRISQSSPLRMRRLIHASRLDLACSMVSSGSNLARTKPSSATPSVGGRSGFARRTTCRFGMIPSARPSAPSNPSARKS